MFFTPTTVFAWGTFVAITLALALIVQVLATSAVPAPVSASPPDACLTPFPAQAALLQGDDVLAGYLAKLCATPIPDLPDS
jgi:hypothetical protein